MGWMICFFIMYGIGCLNVIRAVYSTDTMLLSKLFVIIFWPVFSLIDFLGFLLIHEKEVENEDNT